MVIKSQVWMRNHWQSPRLTELLSSLPVHRYAHSSVEIRNQNVMVTGMCTSITLKDQNANMLYNTGNGSPQSDVENENEALTFFSSPN